MRSASLFVVGLLTLGVALPIPGCTPGFLDGNRWAERTGDADDTGDDGAPGNTDGDDIDPQAVPTRCPIPPPAPARRPAHCRLDGPVTSPGWDRVFRPPRAA